MKQKIVRILTNHGNHKGEEILNNYLEDAWKVVKVSQCSCGKTTCMISIIFILEK